MLQKPVLVESDTPDLFNAIDDPGNNIGNINDNITVDESVVAPEAKPEAA